MFRFVFATLKLLGSSNPVDQFQWGLAVMKGSFANDVNNN